MLAKTLIKMAKCLILLGLFLGLAGTPVLADRLKDMKNALLSGREYRTLGVMMLLS